jgi:hypothetical protein
VVAVIEGPRQLVVQREGEPPLEGCGVAVQLDQQALVQVPRAALEAQLVRDAQRGAGNGDDAGPRNGYLQPALDARHRHHVCAARGHGSAITRMCQSGPVPDAERHNSTTM